MRDRTASWLAWSLLAVYTALEVATVFMVGQGFTTEGSDYIGAMMVGFAVVGLLVARHRPQNAIGWLLLATALSLAVQVAGALYVLEPSRPGRVAVGWVTSWSWFVWLVLVGIAIPLLFPDGRLLSRRWRPVAWLAAAGLTGCSVGSAFSPGHLALSGRRVGDAPPAPIDNPFGASGVAADVFAAVTILSTALLTVALVLTAVSIVMRFRRARGVEHQQLKWFAFAGLVMLGGLALAAVSSPFEDGWGEVVGAVGWTTFLVGFIAGIPVSTGIAILRHRLYDIDVVINRTLVYGSLTAVLAATYLGSVLVLRLVLDPVTGESDLAVAGSTLAVAAMVRPLRSRIQDTVDRRFYRARYDAARTLEAFSGRLRHELDLETVGADLSRVVSETVHPVQVSLWLREARR
jgi:hypothetical protein